jgi:hypothetical protein
MMSLRLMVLPPLCLLLLKAPEGAVRLVEALSLSLLVLRLPFGTPPRPIALITLFLLATHFLALFLLLVELGLHLFPHAFLLLKFQALVGLALRRLLCEALPDLLLPILLLLLPPYRLLALLLSLMGLLESDLVEPLLFSSSQFPGALLRQ